MTPHNEKVHGTRCSSKGVFTFNRTSRHFEQRREIFCVANTPTISLSLYYLVILNTVKNLGAPRRTHAPLTKGLSTKLTEDFFPSINHPSWLCHATVFDKEGKSTFPSFRE
jgi:hypothetical protein